MTEPNAPRDDQDPDALDPLPGEAGIPPVGSKPRRRWSRKGIVALVLLLAAIGGVIAVTVSRFSTSGDADPEAHRRAGERPAATTAEPRRLEMPALPFPAASAAASAPLHRIPAIEPTDEERAEPIGVRRTASGASGRGGPKAVPPEDAPVMLVSTRPGVLPSAEGPSPVGTPPGVAPSSDPLAATTRNLQGYQRQIQGLLDTLGRSTALATGQGVPPTAAVLGATPAGGSPAGGGLFGGQLSESPTPRVAASSLGNRSLTLPKGTAFTCALKTRVISAVSGLVGCQVLRNVYSDDGRVLLIERGSHMDGEYRIGSVRPGMVRIPVLWTRIRTPVGVTLDIASPGTGPLGESGIDGYVDQRWGERIGAAMLLSLIDDTVQLVIQNQMHDSGADTIVLPSTTANASKLAEKVLESTINIPPLVYQNQGGIVGIYVARDVDFSAVYELQPIAR